MQLSVYIASRGGKARMSAIDRETGCATKPSMRKFCQVATSGVPRYELTYSAFWLVMGTELGGGGKVTGGAPNGEVRVGVGGGRV
jgi:hypothetical protein